MYHKTNKQDLALEFPNPRLLATVFYGLLSVVGTILINGFLTIIGIKELVPLFEAIILGMVVASITGAIFGKNIVHCPRPYKLKTFFLGFIMVLLSLPFFDLGLLFFMYTSENPSMAIANAHDFISAYLLVLGYSYILFGFLLAIASGLASIYLRGQFVYHVLHTDQRKSHRLPRYINVASPTKEEKRKTKTVSRTRTLQRKKS
ncbi:Uncharacterised protein [Legionella wadsworthii]|uniref:Uncharacterized protein n=1 Tax=Legionella wadsworthii TaxID=28088 RepID=A0A378LVZ5_9GAMM|nr:hypothetical protein [Legionella wadsworthii]STY30047.1 Uncharacterised protein [Legionella wadsworthii]